jgi:predicted ATP-grasp superfamily ATP-dependent carboligase
MMSNDIQISRSEFLEQADTVPFRNTQMRPRRQTYDALILDAGTRKALTTVRSLGRRGLRVAALETADALPVPAFSSRWCQHKFLCRTQIGSEEYLAYLEHLLDTIDVHVLIPSADGTIALIRQHREKLEQRVRIALAKEPALRIAVNKGLTLATAKHLGMRIPRAITVQDAADVTAAVQEIGLPVVVKPVESWVEDRQQRARVAPLLVTTIDEAHHAVETLTRLGGVVLFQQFLSGRHESVSFLYANRQVYARFAHWSKRTDPPLGGTDVLRQSIAIPADTGEQAERLVREIDLDGYCEVEFRRDSEGQPYLMEINPRLNASLELAVRAGIDYPYLLYQWASGQPIDTVETYRVGRWMRYLWGDIASTAASLQQQGRPGVASSTRVLLDFCTSFFVPMRYDYLDWSDPLPLWAALVGRSQGLPKYLRKAFLQRNTFPH